MGVVYEGDDPELGRRVALKLVRTGPPRGGADDSAAPTLSDDKRDRLLREAQAACRAPSPDALIGPPLSAASWRPARRSWRFLFFRYRVR